MPRAPSSSARSPRAKTRYGFNAATEKFEDLVAAGVIDPAKVTRTALQNAASIAGLMLTTEAMIAELPDEKGEAAAAWAAAWAAWEWECNFPTDRWLPACNAAPRRRVRSPHVSMGST